MINVVINCRFLTQNITGVQRFGQEITKYLILNKNEINFECVAPKNILHTELAELLNVKVVGSNSGHLWEQIELPLYLRKRNNPLLLNLANTAPLFYTNSIVTIHDIAFKINKDWFSFSFRIFYNFLIPRILKKSKHVITVSNFSKSEIVKYMNVNPQDITVVYNGLEHLKPLIKDQSKDDYYLVVGSLDPRKNLTNVLKAFNILNYKIKVVGGSSKSFKKENISNTENVDMLGRVSDNELIKLYSKAKGFIYLSLYEGFGIPPLESIMYGTVPIVSDIKVFHEILGNSAYYCNPTDINEIIDTVNMFELKNEKSISNNTIEMFKEKYSWKKSATEISSIVKQIIFRQ